MRINFNNSAKSSLIIGSGIGVIFFLIVWGVTPLNPLNFRWMINPFSDDFTFSALAALAYVREGWAFPPGVINSLVYPAQTSVVFADNIPIAAVVAKAVSKIIGVDLQYYGIWGLICAALQGGLSAAIIFHRSRSTLLSVLGALFVLCSPFFLGRMFNHVSMGGQWVVLLSILLVTYSDHPRIVKHEVLLWSTTIALSAAVLAYFTPMTLGLAVLYYWLRARLSFRTAALQLAKTLAIAVPACFVLMWLGGGLLPGMTSGGADYGSVGFNLSSFIDPGPFSRIFPAFPVSPDVPYPWESFAWLGLGIVTGAIILLAFKLAGTPSIVEYSRRAAVPYIVVCICLVMFAATHIVRFSDGILFSYPLPDILFKIFSTFRSSARIVWPVWYLLVFLVVGGIAGLSISRNLRAAILISLLVLQLGDGFNYKATIHDTRSAAKPEPMSSSFWRNLDTAGQHVNVLPFWGLLNHERLAQIAYGAIQKGVTMNVYWLGRYPMDAISASSDAKVENLRKGNLASGDILIFNHVPYLSGIKMPEKASLYLIDDLVVVAKSGLEDPANGIKKASLETRQFAEYIKTLSGATKDKTVVLSGTNSKPQGELSADARDALKELGLVKLSQSTGSFAYAAIIRNGILEYEETSPATIDHVTRLPANSSGQQTPIHITAIAGGNSPALQEIGGRNSIGTVFGLNITTYDEKKNSVVERAVFSEYSRQPGVVLNME